jgi:catechol 2,3-dioxygenase-like lactoylglutathione lyase family enzyme
MIPTYGLTHIVLAVRDAERAAAFYRAVFGAIEVWRGEGRIDVQTPGCKDIIVFDESELRAGEMGGIAHIGFRLLNRNDIDQAAHEVTAAGGSILSRGEFVPGEPYLFARDVDGYELEIWFELEE